jgi:hypothetical protein
MRVTIELDDYLDLPPRQLKAALRALRAKNEPPSRTRTRVSLFSEDSKNLEREREEQLPRAWLDAAVAERSRAGLPEVNLEVEYRKFVLWYADKGREIRLGSWLIWAVRAWLDRGNMPAPAAAAKEEPAPRDRAAPPRGETVMAEIRQRGELRQYFERGHWPPNRGPKPDDADCRYPAELIKSCRQQCQQRGSQNAKQQAPPPRETQAETAASAESDVGHSGINAASVVHRPRRGNVWRLWDTDQGATAGRDRQGKRLHRILERDGSHML